MRILLLGNDYFRPWLRRAGARVVWAAQDDQADLAVDPDRVDLAALAASLEPRPDCLLLTDDLGRRALPWGLERLDLPRVYYAVDGPINLFWQRHLAGHFDLVAVDQKDSAAELSARLGREVLWLPVAVDPALYQGPAEREEHDFVFVGTMAPKVRPKRSAIIELLKSHYQVKVAGQRGQGWVGPEEAARLYRRARLVLNENLFPGVTTRMLEAMASGACLFSEDSGGGLRDLFRPDEHLVVFGPDNVLAQAERYLSQERLRRAVARAGQAEVLARHSIAHRAQTLLAALAGLERGGRRVEAEAGALGWAFLWAGLRWPDNNGPRRIMKARLMFKEALAKGPERASDLLFGLGLCLTAQGRPVEAAEALARAAGLGRADWRPVLALGLVLFETREVERAEQILAQAAELAQPPAEAAAALVRERLRPGQAGFHLAWGLILTRAGEGLWPGFNRFRLPQVFWGGLEHLSRALELEPDNLTALTALADLLDSRQQQAFSLPLWQRAAGLAPRDPDLARRLEAARRLSYQGG